MGTGLMPTTAEVNAAAENFITDTQTANAKINGAAGDVVDRHGVTTPNLEKVISGIPGAVVGGAGWRDFPTAVDVLSDAALTYAGGQPETVVAGDIIRTRKEGLAYSVAGAGASDHSVTTAGGVKLYAQPGAAGFDVRSFGAVPNDTSVDNYDAIRRAISYAITQQTTQGTVPAVYFTSGQWTVKQTGVFSGFTGPIGGLNINGDGFGSTSLRLETGGVEMWWYDTSALAQQYVADLKFENLELTTDDTSAGNCVRLISDGTDKRPHFVNCRIYAATVLETRGTGNADLSSFTNCLIYSYQTLLKLKNTQSVVHNFVSCNIILFGNGVRIEEGGGDVTFNGGIVEMYPTVGGGDTYLVEKIGSGGMGLGNCNVIFAGVRFELDGGASADGACLVKTPSAGGFVGPLKVAFNDCGLGNIRGVARNHVNIGSPNTLVTINGGTLAKPFQSLVSASSSLFGTSIALPGHLVIDGAIYGGDASTPQLSNACTVTGDLARTTATNIRRSIAGLSLVPVSDCFDRGVPNRCHAQPPAVITSTPIRLPSAVWPNNTTENTFVLPANIYVKRLFIYRPAIGAGSSASYQLFVGSDDKSIVVGSSTVATFDDLHEISVFDYGNVSWENWRIWATTTTTNAFTNQAGRVAYIEYF